MRAIWTLLLVACASPPAVQAPIEIHVAGASGRSEARSVPLGPRSYLSVEVTTYDTYADVVQRIHRFVDPSRRVLLDDDRWRCELGAEPSDEPDRLVTVACDRPADGTIEELWATTRPVRCGPAGTRDEAVVVSKDAFGSVEIDVLCEAR